ncbi:MAG: hypothetical protein AVDCRST_MAG37-545, partial [uncultured Rubrobacteraceae bacterium]
GSGGNRCNDHIQTLVNQGSRRDHVLHLACARRGRRPVRRRYRESLYGQEFGGRSM